MAEKLAHKGLKQQISDFKKKEEICVIQNKEEKYRILFEKSKDAILIIENYKFVDCNQAATDMLGYKTKISLPHTHPSQLSPDKQPDGKDSFIKANGRNQLAFSD